MRTGLLIAEADADLRRIYAHLSSILGIPVETAADGLECWAKLRARAPRALVVDVEMPWGGGDGVLARLREDASEASVPAIFVTGAERPEVLSIRFGIPLGRCFQKPIQLELARLLNSICVALVAGGR